jgi:HK97 family phage major capsid protein
VASDTYIDVIQHAITQVEDESNLPADGIILNNLDWASIQLQKTAGTGITQGLYIFSNPHQVTVPTLWGLPVVATKSMARGQFLVGAFQQAATIWDRNDATVEVSREHSDFWIKNLACVLCESRLTLTVYRPLALCQGGFPYGS